MGLRRRRSPSRVPGSVVDALGASTPATGASPGASTAAAGHEVFLRNMAALWRADPELALRVDAVEDDRRLPVEPARRGGWTVRAVTPSGAWVYLHSRYDPEGEARKLAQSVALEDKYCFVVHGFGLGVHLRALAERLKGDAFLLCMEPSVEMIATALAHVDLADIIRDGRLVILVDDDKARMHERLDARNTLMMLGLRFVRHDPSIRLNPEFHARMANRVSEFATYTRMSLLTLVANSKITCRNIAMNAGACVSTPPIDVLRDRFKGIPAVIVSAGPSLRRNIDQLAAARGRVVLVAVQSTLKLLLNRGIRPNFVTSLDFHEVSRKFFEELGDVDDVHLVAEPKVTWGVIDQYPGPTSLLDNHWLRLLLGDALGPRDGLRPGATVAHLAFYLAEYMGCDPIIFVGQDLAFTGHVFYVPGVETHLSWRGEINRFNTMEVREWERIARNGEILRRVPGVDGGRLYTDELLFTYLEQFEKDIASSVATVINASEGGAVIRGTRAMPLREALGQYGAAPFDPAKLAYLQESCWSDRSGLPAARDQMRDRLTDLDDVSAVCKELLTLLKKLKTLTDQPDRFNRCLVRVDELRTRVHRATRSYELVNTATQTAELRRYSADRRLQADEPDTSAERALRQLERDVAFITGVAEGTEEVRRIIQDALERVERAIEA